MNVVESIKQVQSTSSLRNLKTMRNKIGHHLIHAGIIVDVTAEGNGHEEEVSEVKRVKYN